MRARVQGCEADAVSRSHADQPIAMIGQCMASPNCYCYFQQTFGEVHTLRTRTKAKLLAIHKTFTSGQAAKMSRLPYHTVNYWAKTGLLSPSVPARGSSTCRGYSFSDLVAMRIAAKLKDAGVGSRELRKVVEFLGTLSYQKPLRDAYLLITHNGDVEVIKEEKLISAVGNSGQVCFVFAIGGEVKELLEEADVIKSPTRGKATLVAS